MSNRFERLSWGCLIALFVINATSIFGYAVFSLHPELLARWPWTQTVFQMSYAFFAKLQIVIAFVSLAFALMAVCRGRWLPAFLLIAFVSSGSELLGTTFGIPFGKYEYTALLGQKMFDRVPYLIPLSWFFMSTASFALSRHVFGNGRKSFGWRIVGASVLLLAWDLTLDPAMSHLSPFWIWSEPGVYFGTPLKNLVGWFVTGLANMLVLEVFGRKWINKLPSSFAALFYLANLSLPLGLVIAAGLWTPVAVSVVVYALFGLKWVKWPGEMVDAGAV
jgi:uncharacterized membrane protein